jgi:hypothetical protein
MRTNTLRRPRLATRSETTAPPVPAIDVRLAVSRLLAQAACVDQPAEALSAVFGLNFLLPRLNPAQQSADARRGIACGLELLRCLLDGAEMAVPQTVAVDANTGVATVAHLYEPWVVFAALARLLNTEARRWSSLTPTALPIQYSKAQPAMSEPVQLTIRTVSGRKDALFEGLVTGEAPVSIRIGDAAGRVPGLVT